MGEGLPAPPDSRLQVSPAHRDSAADVKIEETTSTASIRDGIARVGGARSKHFLEEELEVVFDESGLVAMEIEKVEYSWSSEFEDPPKWMREPYPWDWLISARKV